MNMKPNPKPGVIFLIVLIAVSILLTILAGRASGQSVSSLATPTHRPTLPAETVTPEPSWTPTPTPTPWLVYVPRADKNTFSNVLRPTLSPDWSDTTGTIVP